MSPPDDPTASLPEELALGLLKDVGGKFGALIIGDIIDDLFPAGVPSYFAAVYQMITQIVRQELQSSVIDQINGTMANIVDYMKNEYAPAKSVCDLTKQQDRQRLMTALNMVESTYLAGAGGMIGTLQNPDYAMPGFQAFLIAAGEHLAVLQEMALVDPDNCDASGAYQKPTQSSYGLPQTGSVALTAKEYADFADQQWSAIKAQRATHNVFQFTDPMFYPAAYNHDAIYPGNPAGQLNLANYFGQLTDDILGATQYAYLLRQNEALTLYAGSHVEGSAYNYNTVMDGPIGTSTALVISDVEQSGGMYSPPYFQRTITDAATSAVVGTGEIFLGGVNQCSAPIVGALLDLYNSLVLPAFGQSLGDPDSVIANWRALIDQPVPAAADVPQVA